MTFKKYHHYIKRATAFSATAIILLSLVTFNQSTSSSIAYDDNGIIHGAMTDAAGHEDGNADLVNAFNNLAGKKIGVAYFSDNWFHGIHFPLDKCISIRTTGAVPFIRMQNWVREGDELSDAGPYTHKNIVSGMFDTELRAYAQAAKNLDDTVDRIRSRSKW